MTVQEKKCWKNWGDGLRQEMMASLTAESTRSVESIISETGTTKAQSTLQSVRFWKSCQAGKSPNDALTAAGFEIEFQPDEGNSVQEVTFRLNKTWMSILNRVVERNNA